MTSTLFPNSLAAAIGVGVENVQVTPVAETLQRRILMYGLADPDLEGISFEYQKLYRVSSPEEVGLKFGYGFELYRIARWLYKSSGGVETWAIASPEDSTPVQATGAIQVMASGVLSGILHLYISGEYVPVLVNDDDTSEDIENAIVAALNADRTLYVYGSTTAPIAGAANVICKNGSYYGNFVKITFNEGFGQSFPIGVSVLVTQPSGGVGGVDFSDSYFFDWLGVNDEQNEKYFTDLVTSSLLTDSTVLDLISNWNGRGNTFSGNYAKLVQRPLRSLYGNFTSGDAGFNYLTALGDTRKYDRTNGVIAVPTSPNHPQEIAAVALGHIARINNGNAAESYVDVILDDVLPGTTFERWTSDYSRADLAVRAGISPTIVEDGVVKLRNVVTFYHPDDIPTDSNGYRSMRAISVLQNITNSVRANFAQERWRRISIVADVSKVTSITARQKVKDKQAVQNDIIALARAWESLGWIYAASFTIDRIKTGNYVEIRPGGTGFNVIIPVILSGEAWVTDTLIQFDTALTVFTQ